MPETIRRNVDYKINIIMLPSGGTKIVPPDFFYLIASINNYLTACEKSRAVFDIYNKLFSHIG